MNPNNPPLPIYKVALVGHSNTPRSLHRAGCEIRTFRSPGARLSTFQEDDSLSQVLEWRHHLTIVFLGGNDVVAGCTTETIHVNLRAVLYLIRLHCSSEISIVLLEPRIITNPRWGVTTEQYTHVSRSVNRRIIRNYRGCNTLHFNARPFRENRRPDGCHWTLEGRAMVAAKFLRFIRRKYELFIQLQGLGGLWLHNEGAGAA